MGNQTSTGSALVTDRSTGNQGKENDCITDCTQYADFHYSVQSAMVQREATEALKPAMKEALQEMKEQDSVREALRKFEADPNYLKLDAVGRNRALISFHDQLEQQMKPALGDWAKSFVRSYYTERQEKLFEHRAMKLTQCMRVCEGWEGTAKIECMLGALKRRRMGKDVNADWTEVIAETDDCLRL